MKPLAPLEAVKLFKPLLVCDKAVKLRLGWAPPSASGLYVKAAAKIIGVDKQYLQDRLSKERYTTTHLFENRCPQGGDVDPASVAVEKVIREFEDREAPLPGLPAGVRPEWVSRSHLVPILQHVERPCSLRV